MNHGGCFACGSESEPVLRSKTVAALDKKGLPVFPRSVALCDPCWPEFKVADERILPGNYTTVKEKTIHA